MGNLKEIRIRIASVKSTQQITSAMKLVSASKFRKSQTAILKLRPYASKLNEVIQNLSASADNAGANKYSKQREIKNILIVALSSNKGLCGAFNSNIIKETNHLISLYKEQHSGSKISLIGIGRKVSDYYSKRNYNVIDRLDSIFDSLTFDNSVKISEKLINYFTGEQFDKIVFVYNKFKNASVQILTSEQFLPVIPSADTGNKKTQVDYIFEPSQEEILEELIPKALKIHLYRALLDSNASEHGARMTAMHKATDNATELLKNLNLAYNKARQASITNEILEIVGGAEALKG